MNEPDLKSAPSTPILLPLGLGVALSLVGDSTMYTVLPTHTAAAGISLAAAGILLGANRMVRLASNSVAGWAFDALPLLRRRLFVLALLLGALSSAGCAVSRGFAPLLASRIIWGLAWSGIWVGATGIILESTGEKDRGKWLGFLQTWFMVGTATGALLGGTLTDLLGFRLAMGIAAVLTALGILPNLALLPAAGGRMRPDPTNLAGRAAREPFRWNRGLLVGSALQAIDRFILSGILSATMSLLVRDKLSALLLASALSTTTGLLTALRTLLGSGLAPLAGVLSDLAGNRGRVLSAALLTGAVSMACIASGAPVVVLAGLLLSAFSMGAIPVLVTAILGEEAGKGGKGRSLGVLNTARDLGSAIGPPVAFPLLAWIGYKGLFLLCSALYLGGWLLALVSGYAKSTKVRAARS